MCELHLVTRRGKRGDGGVLQVWNHATRKTRSGAAAAPNREEGREGRLPIVAHRFRRAIWFKSVRSGDLGVYGSDFEPILGWQADDRGLAFEKKKVYFTVFERAEPDQGLSGVVCDTRMEERRKVGKRTQCGFVVYAGVGKVDGLFGVLAAVMRGNEGG